MAAPEAPLCYVGVAKKSAAFRLMKQMGWVGKKAKGLERRNKGLKVMLGLRTNKILLAGIGLEKPNAWAFDTTQFDGILKKLKVQATVVEEKDDDDPDTDSPKGKEDNIKATRPQGRYKRREKGKHVRAFSAQDLEGILVKKVEENLEPEPDPFCYENEDLELADACVNVPEKSLKFKKLKLLLFFSKFSSEKDALAILRNKLEGSETFAVQGKKEKLDAYDEEELETRISVAEFEMNSTL